MAVFLQQEDFICAFRGHIPMTKTVLPAGLRGRGGCTLVHVGLVFAGLSASLRDHSTLVWDCKNGVKPFLVGVVLAPPSTYLGYPFNRL